MYFRLYRSDDTSAGNAFLVRRTFVLIRIARFTLHWRKRANHGYSVKA